MVKKEIENLDQIGVLEQSNESEWGALYFDQLRPKSSRVKFLRKFRNINSQIKHKPYPMKKYKK